MGADSSALCEEQYEKGDGAGADMSNIVYNH
jgi:hypothetical protein